MQRKSGCYPRLVLAIGILIAAIVIILLKQLGIPATWLGVIVAVLGSITTLLTSPTEILGEEWLAQLKGFAEKSTNWLHAAALRAGQEKMFLASGAMQQPLFWTIVYVLLGGVSGWLLYCIYRFIVWNAYYFAHGDFSFSWLNGFFSFSTVDAVLLGLFYLLCSFDLILIESRLLTDGIARYDPTTMMIWRWSSRLLNITTPFPGHFLCGLINLLIVFPLYVLVRLSGTLQDILQVDRGFNRLLISSGIGALLAGVILIIYGTAWTP